MLVHQAVQNFVSTRFHFLTIVSPMAAEAQLTPMMAQYRRIKGELPKDALLLFRLGDFYEMFFEDAQTGAQILNLALTARNGVPMCGLPHHAANAYIGRLLKAGRKVAICDQLEDARPGKLVKREVTQILSPGTHFDERMLVAERNNFLAAVCPSGKNFRPRAGGFDHRRFSDDGIGRRCRRCSPNWNGCVRRKSFIRAKRRRCAICCAVRSKFSTVTTTGHLRRKPRCSPCATISRSRRSTASG